VDKTSVNPVLVTGLLSGDLHRTCLVISPAV